MKTESKFIIAIAIVTIGLLIGGVFLFSKNNPQSTNDKQQDQTVDQSLLLSGATHTQGEASASAKIVEFGDFQCPACGQAYPIVKKVLSQNEGKFYFVFKNYPLAIHQNAKIAAQAAEAAGIQGKFWEMHDRIYENQNDWSEKTNAEEIFTKYAQEIGLDVPKFKEDLGKTSNLVMQDYALGNKVGIESTPTFIINGKKYPGVINEQTFQSLIDGSK